MNPSLCTRCKDPAGEGRSREQYGSERRGPVSVLFVVVLGN